MSKSESTRKRIVDSALELFQEKDFAQATMRDIAKRAGVALGATYYYFKSKDEIVMEFYKSCSQQSAIDSDRICLENQTFEDRVEAIINAKFAQFKSARHFLNVLFRSAVDPRHPLSPFSAETASIRDEAISLFAKAMDGTKVKVADEFKVYLPRLLWLYQLGLILYWIHDESPDQKNTQFLLQKSLKLILQLLSLSRFPFLGGIRKSVLALIQMVFHSDMPSNESLTNNGTPIQEAAIQDQSIDELTLEEIAEIEQIISKKTK